MPPGLQPAHKISIILFLERVYGIPDQETFLRLIEDAFLPDIRSAILLDVVTPLHLCHLRSHCLSLCARYRYAKVTWLWRCIVTCARVSFL